jgi:hypothetical protein
MKNTTESNCKTAARADIKPARFQMTESGRGCVKTLYETEKFKNNSTDGYELPKNMKAYTTLFDFYW